MGRTVIPYSQQIQRVLERLKEFRKSLRKEDQIVFDELIRIAKSQIPSGVMASNPNPYDSMVMSVLVHIKKENYKQNQEIQNILQKLEELSKKLEN